VPAASPPADLERLEAPASRGASAGDAETVRPSDPRPGSSAPRAATPGPGAEPLPSQATRGRPGSGEARAARSTPSTARGGFSAPRLESNRRPRYPEAARAAGAEGTVIVKAYVLASGEVAAAEIARSAGHPLLDRAALDAIRVAQFVPARRGDTPIPFWVEVPVQFRLAR
jgi:protein TonB